MTSPNPMALEAKALEAAFSAAIGIWDDRKKITVAVAAYLAALPPPAAGEGLETIIAAVAAYFDETARTLQDDIFAQIVARTAAQEIRSSASSIVTALDGRTSSRATQAARAAVLEAAIDALIAELKRFDRFVFGGTAQSQGGVGIMKEKMIARLTAIRALKEKT